MNTKFPSRLATSQLKYTVPNGTRMFLFDTVTQFIHKVSFNVGEVEEYGVPNYVVYTNPYKTNQPNTDVKYPVSKLYSLKNYINNSYTESEKTYFPTKYFENLTFSLRTLAAPGANQVDEWSNPYYTEDETQLTSTDYTFYIDQLVYDAQLKETAFRKTDRYVLNIKSDAISNASSLNANTASDPHPSPNSYNAAYDKDPVSYARDSFVPYEDQKTISADIMKDKMWVKRFADKHYLIIFKANNVNKNPRVLFGVKLSDLRALPNDGTRY